MKIYNIILSAGAKKDLASIYDFIAQDTLIIAEKFTNYLEKEIYALEMFPKAFPQNHFAKLACFNLRAKVVEKDYLIIYEIDEISLEIFVHAIMHASRNID